MIWYLTPGVHPEALGFIPSFLSEDDPRAAREQFHAHYIGGWRPFHGFTLDKSGNLRYPGDPPTRRLARTLLRDEEIYFYEHAWVAVIQPNGSFEVCRMD